jgi:hypothetical protein
MSRLNNILASIPSLEIPLPPLDEKFHLFPELPRELRNKIWKLASHEPRIITLDEKQRLRSSVYTWKSTVLKQRRHPSILHTSQEAREEGLRYYELCKEKSKVSSSGSGRRRHGRRLYKNTVYINFSVDVFRLRTPQRVSQPGNTDGVSVDTYNFEADILLRMKNFALIYNTDAYYKSWTPFFLLKAASIQTFTATFPDGFTLGDTIEGELMRRDTRNSVVRTLGGKGFELLFRWEVEEGDDLVPSLPAVAAAGGGGEKRRNQWWMS